MERKFLEDMGIDKKNIDDILDANMKEKGKLKGDLEAVTAERDTLKENLDTAQDSLKKLDGVDIDTLKEQIEQLEKNLKEKDAEYQRQLADRDFEDELKTALTNAKAVNPKAVRALMDIDTLKSSNNRSSDIDKAIAALKESDSNQFGSEEQKPTFVQPSSGGSAGIKPFTSSADLNAHRIIK